MDEDIVKYKLKREIIEAINFTIKLGKGVSDFKIESYDEDSIEITEIYDDGFHNKFSYGVTGDDLNDRIYNLLREYVTIDG